MLHGKVLLVSCRLYRRPACGVLCNGFACSSQCFFHWLSVTGTNSVLLKDIAAAPSRRADAIVCHWCTVALSQGLSIVMTKKNDEYQSWTCLYVYIVNLNICVPEPQPTAPDKRKSSTYYDTLLTLCIIKQNIHTKKRMCTYERYIYMYYNIHYNTNYIGAFWLLFALRDVSTFNSNSVAAEPFSRGRLLPLKKKQDLRSDLHTAAVAEAVQEPHRCKGL